MLISTTMAVARGLESEPRINSLTVCRPIWTDAQNMVAYRATHRGRHQKPKKHAIRTMGPEIEQA